MTEEKRMTEKTAAEVKSAQKIERSCIDCMVGLCDEGKGNFPEFCRTTHLDGELLAEALAEYGAEENHRVAIAAADVEAEGYGIYPLAQAYGFSPLQSKLPTQGKRGQGFFL